MMGFWMGRVGWENSGKPPSYGGKGGKKAGPRPPKPQTLIKVSLVVLHGGKRTTVSETIQAGEKRGERISERRKKGNISDLNGVYLST